jgi:hypothetical protein
MRLRINLFERHPFAAITVEYSVWSLLVNMDNLRLCHIGNFISLFLCPLCPGQVFQPG